MMMDFSFTGHATAAHDVGSAEYAKHVAGPDGKKLDVLTFWPLSETRDRTHPYTGEMGLRLALACPVCTG